MIICHEYKFIFIKTRKTAGTSMEIALSRYCGDDCVITPLGEKDEVIRQKLGIRGPQNHEIPMRKFSLRNWASYLIRLGKPPSYFYNHITAARVRNLVGEQMWNEYFTFCFERNPFDKVISRYQFRLGTGRTKVESLESFVRREGKDSTDFWKYSDGDAIIVDKVYPFEDMSGSFRDIEQRLGLPFPISLDDIKAKTQYRKARKPYWEQYDEPSIAMMNEIFARERKQLGYHYDLHDKAPVSPQ